MVAAFPSLTVGASTRIGGFWAGGIAAMMSGDELEEIQYSESTMQRK